MATLQPHELTHNLADLGATLQWRSPANSWSLAWLLMVGASHAIAKARSLLPGVPKDIYSEADAVLQAVLQKRPIDDAGCGTWMLGYHLNSAELRIQSALHRILQEYTGRDGNAFSLIQAILEGCATCRGLAPIGQPAADVLSGFYRQLENSAPGSALRGVWRRANALKHDPEHNPSELFLFEHRCDDASIALHELATVFRGFAEHRGEIAAA